MFEDYGWLAWIGVAIALGAIEAATVDFVFLMLAGGALGGSVAAALGAGFPVQAIVAVVVVGHPPGRGAAVGQAPVRDHGPRASPWARRATSDARPSSSRPSPSTAAGSRSAARRGRPKSSDPEPHEPGDEVRVVRIDGATAVVTRVPTLGTSDAP